MKKTIRFAVTVMLALLLMLGAFPAEVSFAEGENSQYQIAVSRIDAKKPATQSQLDHYDSNNPSNRIAGNCNISSIITLINRRLAYDNIDATFKVADAMSAYNCKNYTQKGKKLYYPNNNCSDGWATTNYKIGGTSYQAVMIKKDKVEKTIKGYGAYNYENFCQYIALQLHEHPEGIAARFYYSGRNGGHVIVFTKYQVENGKIQLYVYDPVDDTRNMKFENCYAYKNAGKSNIHTKLHFFSYLGNSKAVSYLSADKIGFFEQQSFTVAPSIGIRNTSYSSSNSSVASVDSNGKVTTYRTGVANITVRVGNKNETVKVFVYEPASVKSISNVVYHSLKVTWDRNISVDGFEIQYSTSKDFSGAKKVTVSDNKLTEKKIGSLSFNKTYYVRIRSYVNFNGTKVYSNWSKAVSKKVIL